MEAGMSCREANGDAFGVHSLRQAFAGQMEAPHRAVPAAQWRPDDELEEELAPKQPKPAKVTSSMPSLIRGFELVLNSTVSESSQAR